MSPLNIILDVSYEITLELEDRPKVLSRKQHKEAKNLKMWKRRYM